MGKRFVEPMPFAIEPSFHDSTATSPLIFVLSPGSDPMAALLTFAEEKGIRVESVSLGQGQGPVAQRWIDEGAKEGFWVVLQNCHLAKSFLPALELICEQQLVEGKVGGVQWDNFGVEPSPLVEGKVGGVQWEQPPWPLTPRQTRSLLLHMRAVANALMCSLHHRIST